MIKCDLLSSSAVHRGIELWYCGVERYRMLCECSSESLVLAEICLVMYCPSNEALVLFPDKDYRSLCNFPTGKMDN